jgi:peptidoglycan-N-acetylglucosamine deacetylase
MYFVRTPRLIQALMPSFTWRVPTSEKVIHLTFDDGPIPEVTPWVLDTLSQYDARATFFCVGENVGRYPTLFQRLSAEGHAVGNHTHNHLNGWQTTDFSYIRNISTCDELVQSPLFRPPYGRIKPSQRQSLGQHYQIVMWDVLSGDFDPELSEAQCLANVVRNTRRGSIVVLHDSLKAEQKLRFVLPRVLEHFTLRGYRFEPVPSQRTGTMN